MASYYEQFREKMRKVADIQHSMAVLHWDKETYLPKKGASFRSQQLATLGAIAHNEFVDPRFGRLLNRLITSVRLDPKQLKNVQVVQKEYNKATKFSEEFVKRKSMAISTAFHAWIEARKENDYNIYAPSLQSLLDIIREEAEITGYTDHPYDACLDIYEPGMTVATLDTFFKGVKNDLKPLIENIKAAKQIKNKYLYQNFPENDQWEFGVNVLNNMGYDFQAGRQDISTHPFTTSFSPQDVRVTTRIDENDFLNMTWSCIHEGGHALYEQGLPTEEYGLPSGSAISLAIHESQSRLWENNVGRGISYWKHLFPILKDLFPSQLKKVPLKSFIKGINVVKPNLIRTEADELHYHFHVMIRYEIEKGIMENKYNANDLKKVWNEKYKSYLGIESEDDLNGILQDIHWSHGSIGYFPTYSLGSFYAAQFYAQASKEIPNLENQLKKGKTKKLLTWLRENIHQHGRRFEAEELCEMVTGEKLNTKYFMDYAEKKYNDVYGLLDVKPVKKEKKQKKKSKK